MCIRDRRRRSRWRSGWPGTRWSLSDLLSVEHVLAAGDRKGLPGLVLLLDDVRHRAGHVAGKTAAAHRDLGLVEAAHVIDRRGTRHLAGLQVLHEKPTIRIGPQRPVEEVAGADGVDLDAVLDELEGERLGEPDATELRTGVREVALRPLEPGLRIDLDDVEHC